MTPSRSPMVHLATPNQKSSILAMPEIFKPATPINPEVSDINMAARSEMKPLRKERKLLNL